MIEVYTDGSGTSRGSAGGWAYLLVRDGNLAGGWAGSEADATNNTMELTAAISGLYNAMTVMEPGEEVVLCSDSEYVLGLAAGKFEPSANVQLAHRVRRLAQATGSRFRHVDGHSGNEFNEMCDTWAGLRRKAARKLQQ